MTGIWYVDNTYTVLYKPTRPPEHAHRFECGIDSVNQPPFGEYYTTIYNLPQSFILLLLIILFQVERVCMYVQYEYSTVYIIQNIPAYPLHHPPPWREGRGGARYLDPIYLSVYITIHTWARVHAIYNNMYMCKC